MLQKIIRIALLPLSICTVSSEMAEVQPLITKFKLFLLSLSPFVFFHSLFLNCLSMNHFILQLITLAVLLPENLRTCFEPSV